MVFAVFPYIANTYVTLARCWPARGPVPALVNRRKAVKAVKAVNLCTSHPLTALPRRARCQRAVPTLANPRKRAKRAKVFPSHPWPPTHTKWHPPPQAKCDPRRRTESCRRSPTALFLYFFCRRHVDLGATTPAQRSRNERLGTHKLVVGNVATVVCTFLGVCPAIRLSAGCVWG